jgi:ribosomal protein S18 acetylase RimI-like enzyme
MKYDIVLADLADAPHLASMSARLVEYGLRPSWGVPRIVRQISRSDSIVIKAVDQARPQDADGLLGFAIMSFDDDAAHLNLLAVEQDFQRMRIGHALLAWLEATAITAGTFYVSLEVRASNRGAQDFYLNFGFDEIDCIVGYYSGIEDAVLFARDLRVGTTA